MKRISITILITIIYLSSLAQTIEWAKSIGGPYTTSDQMIRGSSGDLYITGGFRGTCDFDPDSGTYNLSSEGASFDAFISKLDSSGNLKWAKKIGGKNTDAGSFIALDDSGSVYITGYFNDTVDFDPGSGIYNLVGINQKSIFILKLDASGNFKWVRTINSKISAGVPKIEVDRLRMIYLNGNFIDTADFDPSPATYNLISKGGLDFFLLKLNDLGNFVWVKTIGGTTNDRIFKSVFDKFGNSFITGKFLKTVDFDPGSATFNLTSYSHEDIFILKLDSGGNFGWAKQLGWKNAFIGLEDPDIINIDRDGNVYVIGNYIDTVDFDPGTGIKFLTNANFRDVFILKLNSSGNFVWAKNFGGKHYFNTYGLTIDESGSIYAIGDFYSDTTDFEPGSGKKTLINDKNVNAFVLRLDTNGNFIAVKNFGGTKDVYGECIQVDSKGTIYILGNFYDTTDFEPGSGKKLISKGPMNIFISKLRICSLPDAAGTITGSVSLCGGTTSTYSISPVNGAKGYTWSVPSGAVIKSGQNTTSIIVAFGKTSGIVEVSPINSCGSGDSKILSVSVLALPNVGAIAIPSANLCVGSNLYLKGTGAATYKWDGGITDGKNFNLLATKTYIVTGTNSSGCSNTDTIIVTAIAKPQIVLQPVNTSANVGSNATFIVKSSNSNATFQWQENRGSGFTNLSNNSSYSGVTNDTLSIVSLVLSQNNFNFRCLISESGCSDTSKVSMLKVQSSSIKNIDTDFSIYPNPSNGQINILSSNKIENLQITDPVGRLIYQSDPNENNIILQIDKKGICFLTFTINHKKLVRIITIF